MNQLFPSFNQQITMPQLQMPVQQSMLNPVSVGTQLPKVNGLESAKAYQTTPNSQVALFDANEDIMYIKITDASNFPTIRIFKFSEISEKELTSPAGPQYVTIEEFEKFKEEILNGKQSVRSKQHSTRSKWNDSKNSASKKHDFVDAEHVEFSADT